MTHTKPQLPTRRNHRVKVSQSQLSLVDLRCMGFNTKLLRAPSSANAVMLICLAQDNFCVSLLSLSGGSKLELEALMNSSKELKPASS
jgi:hypothetical protein